MRHSKDFFFVPLAVERDIDAIRKARRSYLGAAEASLSVREHARIVCQLSAGFIETVLERVFDVAEEGLDILKVGADRPAGTGTHGADDTQW